MVSGNYFLSADQIEEEWARDCIIDKTRLTDESLKIPQLHSKYIKWWRLARREARSKAGELKRLKLDKTEFYTQGPSNEHRHRGWQMVPKGALKKTDASAYVEADPDVLALVDELGAADDTVKLLESILETINKRSFHINNALGTEKFLNGLDR